MLTISSRLNVYFKAINEHKERGRKKVHFNIMQITTGLKHQEFKAPGIHTLVGTRSNINTKMKRKNRVFFNKILYLCVQMNIQILMFKYLHVRTYNLSNDDIYFLVANLICFVLRTTSERLNNGTPSLGHFNRIFQFFKKFECNLKKFCYMC
jgi:hypothetical protein